VEGIRRVHAEQLCTQLGLLPDRQQPDADLATGNMPTFAWITPNECNNMRWTTGC